MWFILILCPRAVDILSLVSICKGQSSAGDTPRLQVVGDVTGLDQ